MIKYKTSNYGERITKVEVERETENFVWEKINDTRSDRRAKIATWASYFDSFEEAKQYLLNAAKEKVEFYKDQLQRAKSELGQLESLKEKQLNQ